MAARTAQIHRANGRDLRQVAIDLTISHSGAGREMWSGEFVSNSADGILPDERLALTLDDGQKGNVRVVETHFDSKQPKQTLIQFVGSGPAT